jgi:hypothetical protein
LCGELVDFLQDEKQIASFMIPKLINLWKEPEMINVLKNYQDVAFHVPDGCSL